VFETSNSRPNVSPLSERPLVRLLSRQRCAVLSSSSMLDNVSSPAWQYAAAFAAGTALRLCLFSVTSIPRALQTRPELTTPLTAFRSLQEGVFLHERGTNPYDGGVFYHSPLYLATFTYLVPISSYLLTSLLWTTADVASSMALVRTWRSRGGSSRVSNRERHRDPLVAALYLFNPYSVMSCLARSTTTLDNALLLQAVSFAAEGHAPPACLFLALASHTSLYPALLLLPILLVLRKTGKSSSTLTLAELAMFFTFFATFAGVNCMMVGWTWVWRTWGVILSVSDLTPNVGMWWYFFTEMFDHFRTFFLGAFHLYNVIFIAPVCLRLRHDPLLATVVLIGVFSTWKSYPALGDLAAWAGLLGCFPEIISNLRHPLFTLTVYLYTLILLPLLHSLWLLTGTGNANFFYAATMVHGLNSCLAVEDVLGAGLRIDVKRAVSSLMKGGKPIEVEGLVDQIGLDRVWEEQGWQVVQLNSPG